LKFKLNTSAIRFNKASKAVTKNSVNADLDKTKKLDKIEKKKSVTVCIGKEIIQRNLIKMCNIK